MAILSVPAAAQGFTEGNDRSAANARLSAALIRLNHNPRDTEALTTAGIAALATGDTDAAVGFFTRALRLSPDDPQIEAGLAGAKVRAEDPFSAIPLFLAAEKSVAAGRGAPISPNLLGDRGLAYDLIGDNLNAQQYYRQALAKAPASDVGAEVSRRLALSLAIGGDRRGSETVLSTLLQKQDRAAWRARIFALAILGYEEEAVATARSTMPPELALEIAPYLRYMRRLTPAQQAAAANLGHFPQAAEIGHDDPRVAQYAHAVDRSRLGGVDQPLVPAGAPLGRSANSSIAAQTPASAEPPTKKSRRDRNDNSAQAIRAAELSHAGGALANPAPPDLVASRETQPAAPSLLASAPPPPVALVQPLPARPVYQPQQPERRVTAPPPAPAPVRLAATLTPVAPPLPAPPLSAPVAQPPAPMRSLAVQPAGSAPATEPVFNLQPSARLSAAPAPARIEPAARPSFSDAFAALSPVVVDITPERGAVDLRKIKPARPTPPPPPPPSHPSRIWVELGVGRDPDRMAFDWRRMIKDDPEIFRGKKPFITGWARTNRLLVGPFETDKAATGFTEKLHKADHPSAFVWTSPAGQVVDPLDQP